MQRNWIGRSTGAHVDSPPPAGPIEVFTTRPDTLFGATYMVLAPEHPLVDGADRRGLAGRHHGRLDRRHATPGRGGRGVPGRRPRPRPTSSARPRTSRRPASSPARSRPTRSTATQIPVFIADYVLMGYGTGAIMAVPGQDERDWEFAEVFDLPIIRTVQPPDGLATGEAYLGDGPAINSRTTGWTSNGLRRRRRPRPRSSPGWRSTATAAGAVTYRLRDWLFSRQRYWGEPFPIVYDETGLPIALPESMLPVELPDIDDFSPKTFDPDDADSEPEPPLGRLTDWVTVDARPGRRAASTLPARDEHDAAVGRLVLVRAALPGPDERPSASSTRRSSATGWARTPTARSAASTCTSAASSTPCCTCCTPASGTRCCSTWATCRLASRSTGCSTRATSRRTRTRTTRGIYVRGGRGRGDATASTSTRASRCTREYGKMGKSLKNVVDARRDVRRLRRRHAAAVRDVHGPAGAVAAVGHQGGRRLVPASCSGLAQRGRREDRCDARVSDDAARRANCAALLHRTIDAVREGFEALRFNTSIASIIELNNHAAPRPTRTAASPRRSPSRWC